MKHLTAFIFTLFTTLNLWAQIPPDSVKILPLSFERYGKNYIADVKYEVIADKAYALITIQHPVPAMSGCGAMCYRTTVRKVLDADANHFKVVSEPLAIAHDDKKIFILGMERNENKESTDSYLDVNAGMIYTSKGKIDVDMNPLGKLVNELSVTNYDLFDADVTSLSRVENYNERHQLYMKDKDNVYSTYSRINDSDPATFMVLDNYYSRDKNHVYYEGKLLPNLDTQAFRFVTIQDEESTFYTYNAYNSLFVKDNRHVYYKDTLIAELNPATAELVASGYIKDDKHVFRATKLLDVDASSFRILRLNWSYREEIYSLDKNYVYFDDAIIHEADPETFTLIREYAKDKSNVYFRGKKIEGAESETFTCLSNNFQDANWVYVNGERTDTKPKPETVRHDLGGIFETDGKKIYRKYFGEQPTIADAETFTYLGHEYYGKDKERVYYRDKVVYNSDPETFVALSTNYGKDKNTVFFQEDTFRADAASFVALSELYAKDKNNVFRYGRVVKDADPETFDIKTKCDKNSFFRFGDKLEGIDIKSYETLSDIYCKDKSKVFFRDDVIEGANPKTFLILIQDYSRDREHVFIENKMVANADPNSFEILDSDISRDKNYLFYKEHRIIGADRNEELKYKRGDFYKSAKDFYFKQYKMNADIETFEIEAFGRGYSRDKKQVYYAYNDTAFAIKDADLKSFEAINFKSLTSLTHLAKDKNRVYTKGIVIEGADPKTFGLIAGNIRYAKDINHVYYDGKMIEDADPKSFEPADQHGYKWRDKTGMYENGQRIILKLN